MPVTPRGTSWQAQVNHKGERFRRNFETKREAQAWEADSKARLLKGEPVDMGEAARKDTGKPYTLAQLVQHVYDTHWKPQAGGDKALYNARSIVALIGPNLPVAKLGRLEIDKARAKLLDGGNSTETVNRKVAALSKALSVAVDLEIIPKKPKLEKYKRPEGRIRRFTPTEEAQAVAFFEHIGQPAMVDYVLFSLDTGLRQGEVLELKARDWDDLKVTVWGTGAKSGKTRAVPLTARARAILRRRSAGLKPAELVFGDLNRWRIAHYWDRLASALGLQDDAEFVPHGLRHEFCSRLADRGLNAAVIMQLAGHSTLAVTQKYIHVGAQALVDAIAALEAA